MVGLHTCGDLAPSTLRMFVAKPELAAVCSVGCCYHLLSEEFDPAGQGNHAHRSQPRADYVSSTAFSFILVSISHIIRHETPAASFSPLSQSAINNRCIETLILIF